MFLLGGVQTQQGIRQWWGDVGKLYNVQDADLFVLSTCLHVGPYHVDPGSLLSRHFPMGVKI